MGSIKERVVEFIDKIRSSKTLSLLFILFLIAAIPVTVYLAQEQQDIHSRAVGTSNPKTPDPKKPEYVSGEVIVKFRPQILPGGQPFQLKIKEGMGIQSADLDKKAIPFSSLDEKSIPPVLTTLNQRYKIKSVEKVFKGAEEPEKELDKIKSKFSKEISEGKKKIDEQELLKIDLSRTYKLSFEAKIPIELILGELSQSREVLYAEPNYIYKTQQTDFLPTPTSTPSATPILSPTPSPSPAPSYPNDPYYQDSYPNNIGNRDPNWNPPYDYQWNLKKIHMQEAWSVASGSAQVLVAVIDTGVDYTHPEFGGCTLDQVNNNQCSRIAPGFDFVNNDNDPQDDFGHGTHVAGIIAATTNNAVGIAGISPNAKIIPLKALDQNGGGYTNNLVLAVYVSAVRGARVINASWGGAGDSQVLTEAIAYTYLQGITFVAAAGNSNIDTKYFYPANITCATEEDPDRDCTITVASTDQNDQKSDFSNWGSGIDVAAPGGDSDGNVLSLKSSTIASFITPYVVGRNYLRLSGTSMATPHVVALAALIFEKNPTLTNDQTRNAIINGADDLGLPSFDIFYGYGKINAFKTLSEMNTNTPLIARISSPLENFIIGKKFKIIGSSYGISFSNYTIDYATSQNATSWSTQGITLTNSGSTSVHNGLLATADFSNLSNGTYYLRLTTNTSSNRSAFTIASFRLDKSVRDNFPLLFDSFVQNHQPVVVDLNGDKKKEIIFKNANEAKIHVVDSTGNDLPGWPQSTGEPLEGFDWFRYAPSTLIAVDLDPSYPGLEIIAPVNLDPLGSGSYTGVQLLAFHADGSPMNGWTANDWKTRGSLGRSWVLSSGVIQGKNVIIYSEGSPYPYSDPTAKIHVFDKDANELSGWPVIIDKYAVYLNPIISDIDKDGEPEIIVNYYYNHNNPSNTSYTHNIRIYSSSGTLKKEVFVLNSNDGSLTNIVVGDIDKDGFGEIMASTYNFNGEGMGVAGGGGGTFSFTGKIYVWDYLGNIKSNKFPYVLRATGNYIHGMSLLSIGDYNNDGNVEILTYFNNQFYLINKDTKLLSGFPTNASSSFWAQFPFAANITLANGNHLVSPGDPGYWSGLYLYEYNPTTGSFTIPSGYPKNFSTYYNLLGTVGHPALLDVDGDGKLELVAATELAPPGWLTRIMGYLYVFNLDYTAKFLDWPQYLHDERHTGAYLSPLRPDFPR